jgi:hypothetical protein
MPAPLNQEVLAMWLLVPLLLLYKGLQEHNFVMQQLLTTTVTEVV